MTNNENEKNALQVQQALTKLRGINLGEALSESSRRYRRALLGLAVAAFIFAHYRIEVTAIPWLDVPPPADSGNLVPWLVALALGYHWLSLVLYGWADLRKWQLEIDGAKMAAAHNLVFDMNRHLYALKQAVEEREMRDRGADLEKIKATISEGIAVCADATRNYNNLRSSAGRITLLKQLLAWGWEYLLPLSVGAAAAFQLIRRLYA
jgi:hypothetical protein